ncbi:hypothetical protein D3C72_1401750 [compost metagenome]
MGHADQHMVACGKQHLVRGFQQVHEQGIRQQRNQHQHLRALLRGECARRRVWHIAHALGHGAYLVDQRRIHAPLATQGARDGDRAHAGFGSDIAQGDAAAGTGAPGLFVGGR